MRLFAIGDIQGCATAFDALLRRIAFRPSRDKLWLVGDLVNRGPDSLAVMRRVMGLGRSVTCVLGNHDLHLLATVDKYDLVAAQLDDFAQQAALPHGECLEDVERAFNAGA